MLPRGLLLHAWGLGGEGVLRTFGMRREAKEVIRAALLHGIGYFDCARVYAGSEDYYGSVWSADPEARGSVFQASKSASRSRREALRDLDVSLATLNTSYLDLWQIHDVRTEHELDIIAGPGGALEAFLEAKKEGRARYIGVTGHHDPEVLTRAVREWPVDSVMMPVNPAEGVLQGFLASTLPVARERGLAVIGMKILGASRYIRDALGITADLLIRYALSQGITVAIVGCATPAEVQILATVGRNSTNVSEEEEFRLMEAFTPNARKLAFYRSPG